MSISTRITFFLVLLQVTISNKMRIHSSYAVFVFFTGGELSSYAVESAVISCVLRGTGVGCLRYGLFT